MGNNEYLEALLFIQGERTLDQWTEFSYHKLTSDKANANEGKTAENRPLCVMLSCRNQRRKGGTVGNAQCQPCLSTATIDQVVLVHHSQFQIIKNCGLFACAFPHSQTHGRLGQLPVLKKTS